MSVRTLVGAVWWTEHSLRISQPKSGQRSPHPLENANIFANDLKMPIDQRANIALPVRGGGQ